MLWMLAVVKPFDHLGLEVGEVVAVQFSDPSPISVVGRNARPLPTNYGAICGALTEGALVPLTATEADDLITFHQRTPHSHLSLVA